MNRSKTLSVFFENEKVGTLAQAGKYQVAFEYDEEWLKNGFSISPFSLPLEKGVFMPKGYEPFEGIFGVFNDSLPDGWGRLLVDRKLNKKGINPAEVGSLDRLAIVGNNGMGALSYVPEYEMISETKTLTLDEIARECKQMYEENTTNNIDELFRLGGSSGGARPKIFYKIDGEEWIVKFPSSYDEANIGEQEYAYSLCAKKCGIEMSDTRLLKSDICSGYFAVKRFDRCNGKRKHIVSVSGMLETSHRIPSLDYNTLMQLTMQLTRDYSEIEHLYRQMCFNVFAHNRDDHSKNFSYMYEDGWKLTPAYDLTYSNSIGGEHATMINGNGTNPNKKDLLQVAKNIKLDINKANGIADEIQEIVNVELRKGNGEKDGIK